MNAPRSCDEMNMALAANQAPTPVATTATPATTLTCTRMERVRRARTSNQPSAPATTAPPAAIATSTVASWPDTPSAAAVIPASTSPQAKIAAAGHQAPLPIAHGSHR